MTTGKPRHASAQDSAAAVDRFMAELTHPHKDAVAALRGIVTGVDPRIAEGVKWNAPSFRIDEYFATTHLRAKQGFGLILHRGARTAAAREAPTLDDPTGLLTWLGTDRAQLGFADLADLRRRESALVALLRQWILML